MSYAKDRDEFIAAWVGAGGKVADARHMMRLAATQDRLAVAQCNGDWPADNGERPTERCSQCDLGWAREAMRKVREGRGVVALVCPDCRIAERIEQHAQACGFKVKLGGDPRGYTTKVVFPTGAYNTWGGAEDGWGVPVRER